MKNYFYVKYVVSFFAGAALIHDSYAVKINGQEIILRGEEGSIVYEVAPNTTNIAFKIQGDDINVGSLCQESLVSQTTELYNDLNSQKGILGTFISLEDSINIETKEDHIHDGAYLKAAKDICLSSGVLLSIQHAIVEAGENVIFTAPRIETKNFSLSSNGEVRFNTPIENRKWLTGIQLESMSSPELPFNYFFQGSLQLSDPSTDGMFIVVGAKKVTFNLRNI